MGLFLRPDPGVQGLVCAGERYIRVVMATVTVQLDNGLAARLPECALRCEPVARRADRASAVAAPQPESTDRSALTIA